MPRMREAMRSGWNTSRPSRPSPTPANLMGRPVTSRAEIAAPPRASPSSLEKTRPVSSVRSRNPRATLTASCPVMASTTSSTSSGSHRLAHRRQLLHQGLVDLQAAGGVHDHHVAAQLPAARLRAALASLGRRDAPVGDAPAPRCDGPSVSSWSMAAGRCRSAATSSGCLPWPTSGGRPAWPRWSSCPSPAGRPSGSRCGGVRAGTRADGFAPQGGDQLLVDDLHHLLARGEAAGDLGPDGPGPHPLQERPGRPPTFTSASSRARRTSRRAASTSASASRPRLRRTVEHRAEAGGERLEHAGRRVARTGPNGPRAAGPRVASPRARRGAGMNLTVIDHPLTRHYLTVLRDRRTTSEEFRAAPPAASPTPSSTRPRRGPPWPDSRSRRPSSRPSATRCRAWWPSPCSAPGLGMLDAVDRPDPRGQGRLRRPAARRGDRRCPWSTTSSCPTCPGRWCSSWSPCWPRAARSPGRSPRPSRAGPATSPPSAWWPPPKGCGACTRTTPTSASWPPPSTGS